VAWIALVPLLVATYQQPLPRAFVFGLTTGVAYFTGTLYWITRVMVVYGDLPEVTAVLVNAALIAYLSLFVAFFALVTARATRLAGVRGLLLAPFAWVTTELGRTYLFTGFPWVLLGYSQVTVLPVAQVASLVGVYGLSALVSAVSAGAAIAVVGRRGSATEAGRSYLPLTVILAVVTVTTGWGAVRVTRGALLEEGTPVRVGLLQGNVSQDDKWAPGRAPEIFRDYLEKTRAAVRGGAQFVLWPESATPYPFGDDAPATEQMRALAREARTPLLIGSDQVVHGPTPRYYNAAFLVRPDGTLGGNYRKMHLVPFGEYVPLRQVFFFASRLVEAVSDFSAGEQLALLPVGSHPVSTAICYEIVYPGLVRQGVREGSELLTTITNDAWFGATSAPYQHFAQASMRAIENGRYLVRAANTGISGIVDPYGRIAAVSGLFETAVVVGDARFLQSKTFYTRTGDVFAYGSGVATLLALAWRRRRVQ
jgi:apolipoprotein N-acyltransferase